MGFLALQAPHRHNSTALDLAVEAGPGVYTLMSRGEPQNLPRPSQNHLCLISVPFGSLVSLMISLTLL